MHRSYTPTPRSFYFVSCIVYEMHAAAKLVYFLWQPLHGSMSRSDSQSNQAITRPHSHAQSVPSFLSTSYGNTRPVTLQVALRFKVHAAAMTEWRVRSHASSGVCVRSACHVHSCGQSIIIFITQNKYLGLRVHACLCCYLCPVAASPPYNMLKRLQQLLFETQLISLPGDVLLWPHL